MCIYELECRLVVESILNFLPALRVYIECYEMVRLYVFFGALLLLPQMGKHWSLVRKKKLRYICICLIKDVPLWKQSLSCNWCFFLLRLAKDWNEIDNPKGGVLAFYNSIIDTYEQIVPDERSWYVARRHTTPTTTRTHHDRATMKQSGIPSIATILIPCL